MTSSKTEGVSEKSYIITLLLVLLLGWLGIHRFYVGKMGTGFLMLVTFGFLGVWTLIDFLIVLFGQFRDSTGKFITPQ